MAMLLKCKGKTPTFHILMRATFNFANDVLMEIGIEKFNFVCEQQLLKRFLENLNFLELNFKIYRLQFKERTKLFYLIFKFNLLYKRQ